MDSPVRKNALLTSLVLFTLSYSSLEAVTCLNISDSADYNTAITTSDCPTGIAITGSFDATAPSNHLNSTNTFTISASGSPPYIITGAGANFDLLTINQTPTVILGSGVIYETGTITLDSTTIDITLQVASPASLGAGTTVNLSFNYGAPILEFTGSGTALSDLSIAGSGIVTADPEVMVTISGDISGGLFQTNGSGTVVLTGSNSYSGGTNVSSGSTLIITGSNSLGGGAVTLSSGATLELDVNGLTTQGTIDADSSGDGSLLINNSGANVTLGADVGATEPLYQVNVASGVLSTAGFTISTSSGSNLTVGGTLSVSSAVPEVTLSGSGIVNFNTGASITPNSGQSIIASGTGEDTVNINTSVTTNTNGTLGHIGTSGTPVGTVALNDVSLTVAGTDVYSNAVEVPNSSSLTVNSSGSIISGTVTMNGNAIFQQAGGTVAALVTSSGIATHTLSGGTLTSATIEGTSELSWSGGTLGGLEFASGTPTLNYTSNGILSGAITAGAAGVGTVDVTSNWTPGYSIGVSGTPIAAISVTGSNKTLTAAHNIYANTVTVSGASSSLQTIGSSSVAGNVIAGAGTHVMIGSSSANAVTGTVTTDGTGYFIQSNGTVGGLITSSGTSTSHRLSGGTLESATLDGTSGLQMSGGFLGTGSGTAISLQGGSTLSTSASSAVKGNISAAAGTHVTIGSLSSNAVTGTVTAHGSAIFSQTGSGEVFALVTASGTAIHTLLGEGILSSATLDGSSTLNISSGSLTTGTFGGSSQLVMTGGIVSNYVVMKGSTTGALLEGGTISGDLYDDHSGSGKGIINVKGTNITSTVSTIGAGGSTGALTIQPTSGTSTLKVTGNTFAPSSVTIYPSGILELDGSSLTTGITIDGNASGAGTLYVNNSLAHVTLGANVGSSHPLSSIAVDAGGSLHVEGISASASTMTVGSGGTASTLLIGSGGSVTATSGITVTTGTLTIGNSSSDTSLVTGNVSAADSTTIALTGTSSGGITGALISTSTTSGSTFNVTGGTVGSGLSAGSIAINLGTGASVLTMSGGTIAQNVRMQGQTNGVVLSGGTIGGDLYDASGTPGTITGSGGSIESIGAGGAPASLSVTGGTLSILGNALNLTSGMTLASGSTLELLGTTLITGSQSKIDGVSSGYGSFLINGSGGSVTLGADVGIIHPLDSVTVQQGMLTTAGYTISSINAFTVADTLNITSGSFFSTVPALTLSGIGVVNFNDSLASITPSAGQSIFASGTGQGTVNINRNVTTSFAGQLGSIGSSVTPVGTVNIGNNATLNVSGTNVYVNAIVIGGDGTACSLNITNSITSGSIKVGSNTTTGASFSVYGGSTISGGVTVEAGGSGNDFFMYDGSLTGGVSVYGSSTFTQSGGLVDQLTASGAGYNSLSGGTLDSATLEGISSLGLSGSCTLTTFTLNDSTVLIADAGTIGGGNINGIYAVFTFNPSAATLTGPITGSGGTGKVYLTESWSSVVSLGQTPGGSLYAVTINDNKTLTLQNDIYASSVYLGNSTSGSTLTTSAVGLTIGGAIDGAIGHSNTGTLNVNNAGFIVTGNIGLNTPLATLNINNGGVLDMSGTSTSIAAQTITISSGGILKKGSGTLSGAVSVDGTLSGIGTIDTVTVNSGGTIAPGNSPGTMTVTGPLVLSAGSTTNISITPAQSSEFIITGSGSATIGGTVSVVQDAGTYSSSGNYTILSGAYSGRFDGVTGGLSGFVFDLSYDPIGGYVYLLYGNTNPTEISTISLSGNAYTIANYLNSNASSSTIALFSGLSDSQLQSAMNSISPSRNSFASYAATQTLFSISSLLTTHVDNFRGVQKLEKEKLAALTADASDKIMTPGSSKGHEKKFSGWITGFGEFAHLSSISQNPSFRYISGAVLSGLDTRFGDRSLVGGSLGYAHTQYSEGLHAGHGNTNSYVASVYGNGSIWNFYLTPAIWAVFNQTDSTRNISFPGFAAKARADIFSWQMIPHLEVGYDFAVSWGDIMPFTSADWALTWQRGYREHGASAFNAKQKRNNSSMIRSETGFKFSEIWEKSWGSFILKEKASYVFEKPFGTGAVNTSFVGTPSAFTVIAVNQNLNLGAVGMNFLVVVGKEKSIKVDFGYEGEFGASFWSNDLTLTLSKTF